MASHSGVPLQLPEQRIVMLGNKSVGKSSAGNTILDKEEFKLERTAQCVKRQGEVAGRQITVVDTPGWWNNYTVEDPGLLSQQVWDHTIVLFTYGDCLQDKTIEQHTEREGEALQRLVEKCWNRYHVLNNEDRGDVTQVTELLEKIEEIEAGNRGAHFETEAPSTPSLPLRKARSKEIPPFLSEDDLSERWSMRSSGFGSHSTLSSAEASSMFGSSGSLTSSLSSGVGSLASIPESVTSSGSGRRFKLPQFLRPRADRDT